MVSFRVSPGMFVYKENLLCELFVDASVRRVGGDAGALEARGLHPQQRLANTRVHLKI